METSRRLGSLERAIMDQLWDSSGPQTVRQVHRALSARRQLAYSTVMTVLQRLAVKDLVIQVRTHAPSSTPPTTAVKSLSST